MKPTIIDLLNQSVTKYTHNPFLWEKTDKEFLPTTYFETKQQAHILAAGLIQLGVEPGDRVALLSEGRNAWIIGELGILHTGAVSVPLSIKLEESNDLIFRLIHSESNYIMVSGGQLKKIRAIVNTLPLIKKVIVFDEQDTYEPNEISLTTLLENGRKYQQEKLDGVEKRAKAVKPDDMANISYTSGTTADPKGIMLTHRNYTANVEQALTLMDIPASYRTLLILPLDHCFAHVAGFYSFMACGASVGTVQTGKTGMETLKNIPINIKELKPNLLFSVPALAKSFRKNIESGIRSQGPVISWLFDTALKMSYSYNREGYNKGRGLQILKKPLLMLFDKVLFSKIREGFGGKLDFFIGGGALLDIDLQRFYYAIGIPMFQGYGLSEATPIISSNGLKHHKLGSSGYLVKPMDLKICDAEGRELYNNKKGEVVIRGENVMAGYYKNPEATAQILDTEGWLHTGDLGKIDEEGNVYIRGRNKTMILSASGQNIYPEEIEAKLNNMPFVMESLVIESNKRLIALVYPDYDALDLEHIDQNQLENLMEENRKLLNSMVATYENVSKIELYPHEFEKTPKKSIKRYLYSTKN